jgi:hypothetical protein
MAKTKKAPRSEEVKPIFTPVEREIILADMAYLIAKEKESGDWDKWQESQKNWDGRDRPRSFSRDALGRFTAARGRGQNDYH